MFGYSLSHRQERAVLELMGFVATSDRGVTPEERQYVVDLSHDFNASAEGIFEIAHEKSLEEVCDAFEDPTAKRIALIHLIRLAYIDGLYESDEWLGLRQIGGVLGIPVGEAADLEDWVRRGLAWEKEGRELLGVESKWTV